MTEGEILRISLFDGRLRFKGDGSSCFTFAYRIEPDSGYVPFPVLTPDSTENRAEIDCDSPRRFPYLPPVAPLLLRLLKTSTYSITCMVTLTNCC